MFNRIGRIDQALSMLYVASQLAIFLSNSKASAYQCRNWWKPFCISFTIAVVFGLNFTTTIIKYIRTKYEQDRNFIDQGENYLQMAYLEREGTKDKEGTESSTSLEFDVPKVYVDNELQREPDMLAVYLRYAHLGVTACGLLAFTVLVLHTCGSSVCAEDVSLVCSLS